MTIERPTPDTIHLIGSAQSLLAARESIMRWAWVRKTRDNVDTYTFLNETEATAAEMRLREVELRLRLNPFTISSLAS